MTSWSQDDLDRLGGAGEIEVSSVRSDGSLSRPRTVWIVRVGDQLYLRSDRAEQPRHDRVRVVGNTRGDYREQQEPGLRFAGVS